MKIIAAIGLLAASLTCFGCHHATSPEHIDETIETSEATLHICLQAAGQNYDFQMASASKMRLYADQRADEVDARQSLAAAKILCQQEHTNRLLEIQIEKQQTK